MIMGTLKSRSIFLIFAGIDNTRRVLSLF